MSQKLFQMKNPFKTATSFTRKIREQIYSIPSKPTPAVIEKSFESEVSDIVPRPQIICSKQITKSMSFGKIQSSDSQSQKKQELNEEDSIDRHLDKFFENEQNLKEAMQLINLGHLKCQPQQGLMKDVSISSPQDPIQQMRQHDEQPLDFDALREQEILYQNEALTFVPELVIGNPSIPQNGPTILIQHPNRHLMLDLKFDVQTHLNKLSYKHVSRTFLSSQEAIKTKKYILSQ